LNKHTYSKKDFSQFKKSVLFWLKKFGITEWEIDFKQHQIDSVAITTYDNKSKLACFQLSINAEYDFCGQLDMHKLALHEVIHLLLADFGYVIQETKYFDSDLAISHEHAVVMRLMKAILSE
jgi:competence CoiA-like predicted nuclease